MSRLVLIMMLAVIAGLSIAARMPDTRTQLSGGEAPEVRLRKLYIVRPDLIRYPVNYEIVC